MGVTMSVLYKVCVLGVVVASLATSGCRGGRGEGALDSGEVQLSEAHTKQRMRTSAPSDNIFGVELRKPIDAPACDTIEELPKPTCVDSMSINLHADETPYYLDRPYLLITWGPNKDVQAITAFAKPAWSEKTREMLSSKFGKPDHRGPAPAGYTIQRWTYQDAVVDFFDNGETVSVSLKTIEQDARDQAEAARTLEAEMQAEARKRQI